MASRLKLERCIAIAVWPGVFLLDLDGPLGRFIPPLRSGVLAADE